MKLRPLLLAIMTAIAFPAIAASFDCERPETLVTTLICNSPSLSEMDDELSNLYKEQRAKSANKTTLKQQQITWLQSRDQCEDELCIAVHYKNRIAELSAKQEAPTEKSTPDNPKPSILTSAEYEFQIGADASPGQKYPQEKEIQKNNSTPNDQPFSGAQSASTEGEAILSAEEKDWNGIQLLIVLMALAISPIIPAAILSYRVDTQRVAFANDIEVGTYILAFSLVIIGLIFNSRMESETFLYVGYSIIGLGGYFFAVLWGYQRRLSNGIIFGTGLFITKLLFLTLGGILWLLIILVQTILQLMAIGKFFQKKYIPSLVYGVASVQAGKKANQISYKLGNYVNGKAIPELESRLPDMGFGKFLAQGMKGWITSI